MIKDYLRSLSEQLAAGSATEHTHRSTLEKLVKSFGKDLQVSNEPKRIKVGSPDLIVRKKITRNELLPVGYIETKDIGVDLSKIEKTEQLQRYFQLPNLILTDYLEFRWYVNGAIRNTVILGKKSGKKIKPEKDGEARLIELFESFLAQDVTDINNPKDLAKRMAGLCKNIDRIITETFAAGEASDLMNDLKGAFQRTLLPDIEPPQFADMFAQTLGYGLFAARIHHAQVKHGEPFVRTGAAREIPKSNPFLRNLFETMHSTALEDEPFIGFVDDLTAVLAHSDIEAVLSQFGKRTKQEDPILHFYETFLAEYDPKERKRRGVYYTPEPVVSYIVRSVDILLKEKFGLAGGLADESTVDVELPEGKTRVTRTLPRVLILDPACGTGTFLYAVVDLIRNRFMEQNRAGEWQSFVREHLIPRIYGFELQMAPYAVAHLKLAMQLAGQDLPEAQRKKWGYEFGKDERLNVYLTNSLEETIHKTEELLGTMRIITTEANAAANIKNRFPILVVLGNPPYSGHSANKGEWIAKKIRDYYFVDGEPLGEKNPKWLQDDYVKFLRYGQWRIAQWVLGDKSAHGVLGFITNHSYLDNPTFRGMRRSLQQTFGEIYLLDLHGNSKKKEKTPDGGKDENVFDIMQGVAIGLYVKTRRNEGTIVKHGDLWGERDAKYRWLAAHDHKGTEWQKIEPSKPFYLFTVRDTGAEGEYREGHSVQEVFGVNSVGVVTARDGFILDFDKEELRSRITEAVRSEDEILRTMKFAHSEIHAFDEKERKEQEKARKCAVDQLKDAIKSDTAFPNMLYRPFDLRTIFYYPFELERPRSEVMRHMLAGENIALLFTRPMSPNYEFSVTTSRFIVDQCAVGNKSAGAGISYDAPLYLFPADGSARKPNLDPKFVAEFGAKLGLTYNEKLEIGNEKLEREKDSGRVGSPGSADSGQIRGSASAAEFGPEDVFDYIYAVFHSPTYRERYKESLRGDYPRVPLTSDCEVFWKLAALGHELVQYHLLEHPALENTPIVFPERGDNTVERVTYDENKRRVFINKTQYFEKVKPEVWEFHVGGYQVCQKWLKDRKGRALSHDDIRHYEKTVMALGETIRLMREIDAAIPAWPMA